MLGRASVSLTSDGRSEQASAAAYEHEEAHRAAEPVDAHHLGQHGELDGDRGAEHDAVRRAEGGQLGEGGGQRAEEQHRTQEDHRSRQLLHLVARKTRRTDRESAAARDVTPTPSSAHCSGNVLQ